MKTISVYVDGSSVGNSTGPIGYGWVITDADNRVITAACCGEPVGTNNQAELKAAIRGLMVVRDRGLHLDNKIELVSDSTYALNLASGAYKPLKNTELVDSLRRLVIETKAVTRWVKGHSGDTHNESADRLAKSGRDQYVPINSKRRRREERKRQREIIKKWKDIVYEEEG